MIIPTRPPKKGSFSSFTQMMTGALTAMCWDNTPPQTEADKKPPPSPPLQKKKKSGEQHSISLCCPSPSQAQHQPTCSKRAVSFPQSCSPGDPTRASSSSVQERSVCIFPQLSYVPPAQRGTEPLRQPFPVSFPTRSGCSEGKGGNLGDVQEIST